MRTSLSIGPSLSCQSQLLSAKQASGGRIARSHRECQTRELRHDGSRSPLRIDGLGRPREPRFPRRRDRPVAQGRASACSRDARRALVVEEPCGTVRGMEKQHRPSLPRHPHLLPPSLEEWPPDGHLRSAILDVVETLDLGAITDAIRSKDARWTRPSQPAMMVSLLRQAEEADKAEDRLYGRNRRGDEIPRGSVASGEAARDDPASEGGTGGKGSGGPSAGTCAAGGGGPEHGGRGAGRKAENGGGLDAASGSQGAPGGGEGAAESP